MVGPYQHPPIPDNRISPMAIVPQKELGQFRLIYHLSFPIGSSVNDAEDKSASLKYTSIDSSVEMVQS